MLPKAFFLGLSVDSHFDQLPRLAVQLFPAGGNCCLTKYGNCQYIGDSEWTIDDLTYTLINITDGRNITYEVCN